ncbi:MAG: thioredoxin family protein [Chlamydiales bacterium]|nr:thioredoxin family protein [Chlamydiales bacterium]
MKRALFTLFTVISFQAHALEWKQSFEEGVFQSQEEKKPLLLFFTASDWSGWSMKFKDDVLDSDAFKEKIGESFICVEIDSPLHAPPAPEKERFSVDEFPTLLLLAPDQKEIARFGYLPMSGEQLAHDLLFVVAQDQDLSYLLNLLTRGERTQTILKKAYDLAQELCAQEAIDQVLDYGIESKEPGFYLVEKYRRTLDLGLKKSIEESGDVELLYNVALIDFQASPTKIAPLEHFLEMHGEKVQKHRWQLEMMIAQFYLEKGDAEQALEHAEIAEESAPRSRVDEITRFSQIVSEKAPL